MAGLTTTEAQATLDVRFPTTGGTDYIAYSTTGSTEFAGLARTADAATGWAAGGLALAAGITRVMALPAVEAFLQRFVPFLAAQPKSGGRP